MSLSAPSSNASLKPHLVLTLFPDDPSNTSLFLATGALLYSVRTDNATGTTRIHRMRGISSTGAKRKPKEVATLCTAAGFGEDVVVCAERGPLLLRNWLRVQTVSTRKCEEAYAFEDELNRRYEWRGRWNQSQWLLELFAMDAPGAPIARYTRSYFDFEYDSGRAPPQEVDATLTLATRAIELQDLCVASCLFLERTQRPGMMDIN
ncbi:hypothetical protein EXIGLDRAFT_779494 [Exidia glandulosa HHB12029]|uniref:DUF6593 domain-containing protein n=1 Tax=Exidia glandulosa HHB12029 TaxID=1314781 RepID=A0A165C1E2_EXIGL|nr:hypothetical protein EXIGLDRAFT_779494 [Exidia glandulosa HHB12029]